MAPPRRLHAPGSVVRRRLAQSDPERGAVIVMVAVWLPILVLIAAFVVDIANWFVHRRHLQMQADAAALAAAGDWAFPGCSDAAIEARARHYGGFTLNSQIGGTPTSRVHLLMNSRTWHGQTSPVDSTVDTDGPCAGAMVDVKLTETDLPWFLKVTGIVPFINAHARVSIFQADTISGALPVGVPDPRPERAQAVFVDENDCPGGVCRELARRDLIQAGTGSSLWDNSGNPVPLTVESSKIGVRVVLSDAPSGPMDCSSPLNQCYDAGSGGGLLHIRGWQEPGTVLPTQDPKLRDARLFNGTCTGAYFSSHTAACMVGIEAKVDFGTTNPVTDLDARVTANLGGSQSYTLTYAGNGLWRSAAVIPVAAAAGPVSVNLHWEKRRGTTNGATCRNGNNNPCQGDFLGAQRVFAGSTARSGPVQNMRVFEASDPLVDANSLQRCSTCTRNLVVEVGLTPSLQNASSVSDPPVVLRLTGSGSLTQALDCDPSKSRLEDEIAGGCTPGYTRNSGTACPEHNVLWGTAQPWPCVRVETGNKVNQIAAGLNLRVFGDEKPKTCTSPNNWSSFPNIAQSDRRIVQVFLTRFTSFGGSGQGTEPVTGFATFYVTGWRGSGNGFANPCVGQGDDSVPGDGYIVGHFIKYISTLTPGSGTQTCDPNAFGTCIATMTE